MRGISFFIITLIAFSACKNEPKKQIENTSDSLRKETINVAEADSKNPKDSTYLEAINWIDDFKNFRQAVYTNDKAKVKTYFNFPVKDDSSLWLLVNLNETEMQARKAKYANPDWFYEEDFDKYFDRIFNTDFVKSLLKIKTATLFSKHHTESPEFTDKDWNFKMIADFYPQEDQNILQLNISYSSNAIYDNGEQVSEGEHNVIYIFDVVDNKTIIFKKIVIAG